MKNGRPVHGTEKVRRLDKKEQKKDQQEMRHETFLSFFPRLPHGQSTEVNRRRQKEVEGLESTQTSMRPLEVDITTSQPVLLDGQVIDVECQARGAQPKAAIQWFLDDVPLNGSTLATDATRTTSVLHLEAHSDMNGKTLSCRGFNPHLPDSELFDNWVLDVHCEWSGIPPPRALLSVPR
ncbi:hypothetical protein HPB48_018916 [Haemaphysalis longicornis]|uniref:Ig-like domain-containing protein n=1 Tax=Haemaphysalis longicornis TaxID=44386 RepID=A0A9J6G2K0_HAELO|nr:hypothetical protein HPB48_018916 [Haemaphysalis longicornis]